MKFRYLFGVVPLALALGVGAGFGEEPTIDHQPVICSSPGRNTRVCAQVLDDGEVKRVRTYFSSLQAER